MSFFENLPLIPNIRPSFNVGCLFDVPTGQYFLGSHGESILNGGLPPVQSVAGPGNSFKSAIVGFFNLTVAERIKPFNILYYDTENSFTYVRVANLSKRLEKLSALDLADDTVPTHERKVVITSAVELLGDEFFEALKGYAKELSKSKSKTTYTSPFLNSRNEHITMLKPMGIVIDSLSEFKVSAQEAAIVDKHSIGSSGQNILYMRQGIAKKQLITQLPNLCAKSGFNVSMVAHVGDEFELDGYAPKKHKLTHAKKGSKVTGATKAFEFLNNSLYEIFSSTLLNNKERNTGVRYPVLEKDLAEDCVDLMLVNLKITRNKSGLSGVNIDLVISQREGVLPHLSQFHFIKTSNNYGISGNNTWYSLDLLPDIKLSRTTVRGKIDEDPELRRALEITSELAQMQFYWNDLEEGLMCTPEELYVDLKKLGHDWSTLLNTRGYWVYKEDEADELPFLSTMDLLRMRKGLYKPYWMK